MQSRSSVFPMETGDGPDDEKILLHCSVCPKEPKFSDISHLLTHFNSKGHLHYLQQVKLRAISDPAASNQMQRFSTWYTRWNIDGLLADRLAAKDKKEAGKKRKASRLSGGVCSTPELDGCWPGTDVLQSARDAKPEIKIEIKTEMNHHDEDDDPFLGPISNGLRMRGCARNTPAGNPFETPRRRSGRNGDDEMLDDDDSHSHREDSEMPGEDDIQATGLDTSKLKGTIFPGMGLFDAATPEMRRKRNQRKDGAILEQMKASSAVVVPDESIWNEDIELERVRDIYATPSIEGSPVRSSL